MRSAPLDHNPDGSNTIVPESQKRFLILVEGMLPQIGLATRCAQSWALRFGHRVSGVEHQHDVVDEIPNQHPLAPDSQ